MRDMLCEVEDLVVDVSISTLIVTVVGGEMCVHMYGQAEEWAGTMLWLAAIQRLAIWAQEAIRRAERITICCY